MGDGKGYGKAKTGEKWVFCLKACTYYFSSKNALVGKQPHKNHILFMKSGAFLSWTVSPVSIFYK